MITTPTQAAPAAPATEPSALAVRTSGLTKTFGARTVVDGIDLAVPAGAVYGFLGPNGSGKTTTIRMLLGLVGPTRGSRELLGHDMADQPGSALPRVGVLVEGPAFHPHLSGRANLRRLDACDAGADPRTSRARIDAALDRVGLGHAATKRFRVYSLGMKQRLAIAGALLRDRDLLVLDEPTNGLDPQGTREVRHLVGSLAADGTTVLVSSHLLSEVEQMCTHLGVMSAGRLVAQGALAELRDAGRPHLRLVTRDAARAAEVLRGLGATDVAVERDGAGDQHDAGAPEAARTPDAGSPIPPATLAPAAVTATAPDAEPEAIVAALVAAGVGVRDFQHRHRTLEDLFVSLTGEGFEVDG